VSGGSADVSDVLAGPLRHPAVALLGADVLAVRLGWYDQALFINDFRSMLGCTPVEYAIRHGQQNGLNGPS
jgi:hypothetical protein